MAATQSSSTMPLPSMRIIDDPLIVYGVLSILVPSVPAQISGSSMIRIDGSSIFLLLCVAASAAGAALLLKSTKHT